MLKAVVTDPDEVFRLGTAKADENRSFRRYLSTYHVSEKPFQILASEAQRQVDCTACANCCRHSVVPVSKMEIENIARRLGVTPEGVTHHYGSIKPATSRVNVPAGECQLPGCRQNGRICGATSLAS
jgi:hypothetical protein